MLKIDQVANMSDEKDSSRKDERFFQPIQM